MPNSENREHKSLGLTMEGEDQKPPKAEEAATEEAPTPAAAPAVSKANSEDLVGSAAIRPVFLGNLRGMFEAEQVTDIFTKPIVPPGTEEGKFSPFSVDRIDVKRGYCFIFLNDAASQADKEEAEAFVSAINGMNVPNLSTGLRVEFARGDGRVKRKEDDRRKNIHPSETLFVVNFHEETTKREDLQMLFEPFGELVRIDMKRNYAFVQFRTVAQATKAKETTNGGKLDQSVLTVEYVARRRGNDDGQRRRRDDRGPRGGDRRGGRDHFRGGPPSDRYERGDGDRSDRDRHDRGGVGDRHERDVRVRGRDRSPPPAGVRGRDRSPPAGIRGRERSPPAGIRGRERSPPPGYRGGSQGSHGRRSRSRSRSPRGGYRSRSPPRRNYDDRDRGRHDDHRDGGRRLSPDNYRGRGSPERGYGRP